MNRLLFLISLILLVSCFKEDNIQEKGKKPVYLKTTNLENIESKGPQSFIKVGKIFKLGTKIYITDIGSGVHIIDNSNPQTPTKEAFISIYENNDVAVKNNIMFADNSSSLVAIDITDIHNAQLTKRIKNVFENNLQKFPPNYSGFFECVDEDKGFVIDWVDADLKNPDCHR